MIFKIFTPQTPLDLFQLWLIRSNKVANPNKQKLIVINFLGNAKNFHFREILSFSQPLSSLNAFVGYLIV